MYTCVGARICIFIYLCIYLCAYTCMYTYMYVYISTCVFAIMYVHVSVHVCGAHLVDDTRLAAVCFRRHEWFLHRKRYVVSVGRLPVLRRRREQRCVHEGRHMHVKGGTCMEREAHAWKGRHMHGKEGTCMEREAHAWKGRHMHVKGGTCM